MGNNAKNEDSGKQARLRLLDSAEQAFAEKGFDGTSVRDITADAKCNVAAINYHFGGKDNLYAEVFRRRMVAMRDVRLTSIEKVMSRTEQEPTLKELIRAFSVAFLEPLIDQSSGRHFMKLMMHEMTNPQLPKKMFVEELVTPTLSALGKGIKEVCPGLDEEQIFMSIISLIGQLVHIIHLNEIFDVDEFAGAKAPSLTDMVDHIVEFSSAGIRAMAKE